MRPRPRSINVSAEHSVIEPIHEAPALHVGQSDDLIRRERLIRVPQHGWHASPRVLAHGGPLSMAEAGALQGRPSIFRPVVFAQILDVSLLPDRATADLSDGLREAGVFAAEPVHVLAHHSEHFGDLHPADELRFGHPRKVVDLGLL